jgi:hypothetical protein
MLLLGFLFIFLGWILALWFCVLGLVPVAGFFFCFSLSPNLLARRLWNAERNSPA